MKDDELPFDHKSHVLYSKPCKKWCGIKKVDSLFSRIS